MIRQAIRKWLLTEPKQAHPDGGCGCGEHTLEHGGPPRQEILDQPDMNKPGLLFDEKRIVTSSQWLITIWDKPGGYLLGAFIDDTYEEAMTRAKEYAAMLRKEQAMKAEEADLYAPNNG